MLRFLSLFTLSLCLIVSASAQAQYHIKRDKNTGEIEVEEKPVVPDTGEQQSPPAPAALPEKTLKQHANDFYANCMKQDHPILKGDNKDMFCGCTSAKTVDVMTLEQIQAMKEDSKEGQHQRNRMMMFVYTPCIAHPTRALIMDQCSKQAAVMSQPKKTCNCLADGMSKYIQTKAPAAIERAIAKNGEDIDPMRALLESSEYNSYSRSIMMECIGLYENG